METPSNPPPKNKGGRPLGSTQALAKKAREQAAATGLLPHEFLLKVSRGEAIEQLVPIEGSLDAEGHQLFTKKYMVPPLDMRMDGAKAAAPYYAPKLSTVELISGMSEDDLDAFIASAAAEAGFGLGHGGESAESEAEEPAPQRRRWSGST